MKSVAFRALLCGRPSVVIREGRIDQREMARNRLTVDELLEELRAKGCTDPSSVRYAILETNGQLTVLPYAAQQPPSAQDLGVAVRERSLPLVLISDGRLLEDNLRALGRDRAWLDRCLRARGCRGGPEAVFLLLAGREGCVCFLPREERGRKKG